MTAIATEGEVGTETQYSLAKILGIWAAAAFPFVGTVPRDAIVHLVANLD